MVPSGVKSRPATTLTACRPGSLAPVSQAVPVTTRGSTRYRMPEPRQHLGPDVAADQSGMGGEVGRLEQADHRGVHGCLDPLQVDLAVARNADDEHLGFGPGPGHRENNVLQRVRRRPVGPVAAGFSAFASATRLSMVGVSGVSWAVAAGQADGSPAAGAGVATASVLAA